MKNKNSLFLICPDCNIENAIQKKYGTDSFFLTALGTVFNINEFEYAEAINQVITDEYIENIYIVNDSNCTFIKNSVESINFYNTKAEKVIKIILNNNKSLFKGLSLNEKLVKLAELNIFRQAFELLDVAFIGNKINNDQIQLKGVIYDRSIEHFTEFDIDL